MGVLGLEKSFFELFDFDAEYAVDYVELDRRYRLLQQEFHPDRFAAEGDREQRVALQMSAFINEAYDTLKSPLKRAQYLLKLAGKDASGENTTNHDGEFLMQQIMLREQLEEVSEAPDAEVAIEELRESVEQNYEQMIEGFSTAYSKGDYTRATLLVARMQFLFKLLIEVERVEERLLDY
ncbi:co-chaperone protein HscB [Sinobacterium caligoides]|uniref:Co-chaperone protein HscB homolog n=1 Tax=Sinobacterium caligoides TaxID=933926 RepID=A0A3N2E0S9_9GAMM|nr:Fe-S protein assembly co-chaperone HscB [Sinobacterium caligoides]ROS05175.1 co-chaperone protein HscB [Sinobacterium caligoides]